MDGLEGRLLRDGCEGVKEYFTDSNDGHKEAPDLNSVASLHNGVHVSAPPLWLNAE